MVRSNGIKLISVIARRSIFNNQVGAVVVGFDRFFNYYKVQYGTLCIQENPDCLFLATNRDAVTHLTDAQEWAGGGSMVGALVGSTQREPLTVGKPSTFMMDYLADRFLFLITSVPYFHMF